VERLVKGKYPKAQIELNSTPTKTGWLEVQVIGGPLLHSKKNGEGHIDSQAKEVKILEGLAKFVAEHAT